MRRLLGLAVLFVVLSVCVPSYGYFLIYKVSSKVKGADQATNAKVTIPFKGYLVLNIADGNNTLVDANLILYGKNTRKNNVYAQLSQSDSNNSLGTGLRYIGNDMFVGFWTDDLCRFEMLLSGKAVLKDIGLGTSGKKLVAGSIKGVNTVWWGFLLGPYSNQDVSGTANVSATLWTTATRYANEHGWTQDQIIESGSTDREGLIPMLQGKGYVDATTVGDSYEGGVGVGDIDGVYISGGISISWGGYDEIPITDINSGL